MKFAFILYKYFPFGGLQRDFIRIAKACQTMGHHIVVYTMSWEGEYLDDFKIHTYKPKGMWAISIPRRNTRFQAWVQQQLLDDPVDIVVGFNKMPGLDIYYGADTCFEYKARHLRSCWYKYTARYRHFSHDEIAVFKADGQTTSLLISAHEKTLFQRYYKTPDARLHLLPPGISQSRRRPENAEEIRRAFREQFGIETDCNLVLMVGSGFKTKGVDRALLAMQGLSAPVQVKTRLFIVGQDNPRWFLAQAHTLGLRSHVTFFSGRDDIPRFLVGSDLLIHPAYNENTGTVLLEALVAGLPVLCTDVCGYAHYITEAQAGDVIPSPFQQTDMNRRFESMLTSKKRKQWQSNALAFADTADLYSMPERAATLIEQSAKKRAEQAGELS